MTIPKITRGDWLGAITQKRLFPWRYQHLRGPLDVTIDDTRVTIEGYLVADPDRTHGFTYDFDGRALD